MNDYLSKRILRGILLSCIMIVLQVSLNGQERYDKLKSKLDKLTIEIPALDETCGYNC